MIFNVREGIVELIVYGSFWLRLCFACHYSLFISEMFMSILFGKKYRGLWIFKFVMTSDIVCVNVFSGSVEIPTRCSFVIKFIIPKFIEGSTCFERHTTHHQEL